MNKLIITAAVLAIGSSAIAATPQEMIDAQDWTSFASLKYSTITNAMPKGAPYAKQVFQAAIQTNKNVALELAKGQYIPFDDETFAMVKSLAPDAYCGYIAVEMLKVNSNYVWQAQASESMIGSTSGFRTCLFGLNDFLQKNEAEFLRIASLALSHGDFKMAVCPFILMKGRITDETPEFKAWRDANVAAIMNGLKNDTSSGVAKIYVDALNKIAWEDFHNNDYGCSYSLRFFDGSKFGNEIRPPWMHSSAFNYEIVKRAYAAYLANSTDGKNIFEVCLRYPISSRTEIVKANIDKILTSKEVAFKAACFINDKDKILDVLLNSVDNLTPDDMNKIIALIVSLDADYRAVDVIKILKNINAKYTLNLYDDRDTWEPILSKIRALIDVRL